MVPKEVNLSKSCLVSDPSEVLWSKMAISCVGESEELLHLGVQGLNKKEKPGIIKPVTEGLSSLLLNRRLIPG